MIKDEYYVLPNGINIPKVGFGTWRITDHDECVNSVLYALKAGYRHIDTAAAYKNEEFIKEGIEKSGIPRKDLFITSKLHAALKGYDITKNEFNQTLKRLGTDYLDLYLIHAPRPWGDTSDIDYMPLNIESWKAMEDLYNEGKIKAIGVSNFSKEQLQTLINSSRVKPMVNQIKVHIGAPNIDNKKYCDQEKILVEAYCPLGSGQVFDNEELDKVSKKYHVSIAQLCNRWCIQYGTLPLPKSVHEHRIIENIDLNFEISDNDMQYLLQLQPK